MNSDMSSEAVIRKFEELSLNSWPALRSLYYDGWLIRTSGGYTMRSNSVWPLYRSSLDTNEKINTCETYYRSFKQPPIFRIASIDGTTPLDSLLERRGYTVNSPTSVQILDITSESFAPDKSVTLDTVPTENWVAGFTHLAQITPERSLLYRSIIDTIAVPACYVSIILDSRLVAFGQGVLDRGFIGIYGMFTHRSYRRRGLARKLLVSMLAWAQGRGATASYLHVEKDNSPAIALYTDLGFREIYRYHYRVGA